MTLLPASVVPAPRPFFLHGWDFLGFVEAGDETAIPIRGVAASEGPMIIYNEYHLGSEQLEEPHFVEWWLPTAMFHITCTVLDESIASNDGIGRFRGDGWSTYRTAVHRHTSMEWPMFLAAARREGVDYIAEHAAQSLYFESGLRDRLKTLGPVLVM